MLVKHQMSIMLGYNKTNI